MSLLDDNLAKARLVIDDVSEGKSLSSAAKDRDIALTVFRKILSGVRELAVEYAHAREIRADVEVDEMLQIADDATLDPQHARNRLETRKWRASKFKANVYGDRIALDVQHNISINEALSAARARLLRSESDQRPTLDAELVDLSTLGVAQPTDSESVDLAKDARPDDIFS